MTSSDEASVLRHRLNNKLAGLVGNLDLIAEILAAAPAILAAATPADRAELTAALDHARNAAQDLVGIIAE